jgi:hypothetical protein
VSVSHTTRAPRGQEQQGREYFIGEPEFRAMVAHGDFFEWAEVHGNLYGTSREAIEARIGRWRGRRARDRLAGRLQIKKLFPHAVLIFILPPSWDELRQRLMRRGEDGPTCHRQAHGQRTHRGGPGPAFRLRYNQRPVRDGPVRPEDRRPLAATEVRGPAPQPSQVSRQRSI